MLADTELLCNDGRRKVDSILVSAKSFIGIDHIFVFIDFLKKEFPIRKILGVFLELTILILVLIILEKKDVVP